MKKLEEVPMECGVKNLTTMKFVYNTERLLCYLKVPICKGKVTHNEVLQILQLNILWYQFSKISHPSKSCFFCTPELFWFF